MILMADVRRRSCSRSETLAPGFVVHSVGDGATPSSSSTGKARHGHPRRKHAASGIDACRNIRQQAGGRLPI
jgi:hypothetical protein